MLLSLLSLGVSSAVALCALPSAVFTGEVLASYLPKRRGQSDTPRDDFTMAVLVPAHDESPGIATVVAQLRSELGPRDRLVVIADNCTDDTAELARAGGAEVLERRDPERRGKGYALSFGAEHLKSAPPDVVVIMDADCRVQRGTLRALAGRALDSGRPTQAVYLLEAPATGSGLSGISAFAFLVRNLVRPRGLARLGLPCELTGTGMAFPWPVYRDAPQTHGFLAEDRLLGHELALLGTAPQLDEETLVVGELAQSAPSSFKQRRRWEHGGLALLVGTAPRLLAAGVRRLDAGLFAQGLDASVPPLALLVALQVGVAAGAGGLWLAGGPVLPALIGGASFGLLALGVGVAWIGNGRQVMPLSEVARIPRYILWKLPLYGSFARHGAHRVWERTERNG